MWNINRGVKLNYLLTYPCQGYVLVSECHKAESTFRSKSHSSCFSLQAVELLEMNYATFTMLMNH